MGSDGGPAFPYEGASSDERKRGMSLRAWLAGQAIRARWGDGTAMTPEDAAQFAVQLADAVIAELEK